MTESFSELDATDAALDALGRGEAAGDDPLLSLLSTWRADLLPPVELRPEIPADPDLVVVPLRPHRGRRLIAAAAAFLLVGGVGGATAFAGDARPGSPLWPVTKLVYADRAASVLAEDEAEHCLKEAQEAADAGQVDVAQQHLADVEQWLGKVKSTEAASRLRTKVRDVREQLPAGVTPEAGSSPVGPAVTRTPGPRRTPQLPTPSVQVPKRTAKSPDPDPNPTSTGDDQDKNDGRDRRKPPRTPEPKRAIGARYSSASRVSWTPSVYPRA